VTEHASERHVLAVAKGGGFLAGGQFFEFAVRFFVALVLARSLGAAGYGLYALAVTAAVLFAGVALMGLDDAMVRYVAILDARDDRAGLRGTLQIGLGASLLAAVVVGALLLVAARPIAEGAFGEPELTAPLRVLALGVPLLALSGVLAGAARGLGRMDHAALAENVVQSVTRLALLGSFALAGALDVLTAVVVFAVSDAAASVTLLVLLNRTVPLVTLLGRGARRDVREIFAFAIPLWLSGLLRQFRRNIETVMLGALSVAASVGVFSVVDRVNLVGHVFLLAILVSVKPILATLHDRGDRAALARVYRAATRWSLTLNLPFFLVTVLYPTAILSVFGEGFETGASALVLLALAELANAGTGICGPMIDMTGHARVKLANSVLWTVLAVAGGAVLIPRFGVVGAAASALVAIATVNAVCVAEVWLLERFVPFDRTFSKPLAAGLGALLTGWLLATAVPVGTSLGRAAWQGGAVCLAYGGLLLALGPPADDRLVVRRALSKASGLLGRRASSAGTAGSRSGSPTGAAASGRARPGRSRRGRHRTSP
jgi:O-antigen/teichoic acid export membrane protein